jgi:hypothetical protein
VRSPPPLHCVPRVWRRRLSVPRSSGRVPTWVRPT